MSNELNIKQRLEFIRLDTATLDSLRSIRPIAEELLPDILRAFYTHISQHDEIARFFQDKKMIDFAASRQSEHWSMILSGNFGTDYVTSVEKIGQTHARIGLEPQFYLSGYTFLIDEMLDCVQERFTGRKGISRQDAEKLKKFRNAFFRAAMLDMDLAIYFFNAQRANEARQKTLELANLFENEVGNISSMVASAAEEMGNTARAMKDMAASTQGEFTTVSASITQATNGVSVAAESASDLGRAVREIAERMTESSTLIGKGVASAESAGQTIRSLSETADRVGEVISMISDIAEQTNLLALNATIESARAGEAGKGFAVVASEVKTLANQTARATEDIATQIQTMLGITEQSVKAIDDIQTAMNEINAVSLSINSAVEEQAASTQEIARNTSEAASGNRTVSQTLEHVAGCATNTETAAGEVVNAASELSRQSTELQNQVSRFLEHIRAA